MLIWLIFWVLGFHSRLAPGMKEGFWGAIFFFHRLRLTCGYSNSSPLGLREHGG
jgi:hypothetical protein